MFGIVWVISAAMTALSSLIVTAHQAEVMAFHAAPEPAPSAAPPPRARFLDRLPEKIRGGALYALEAEDHYLRAHTSKGADLILMRMADAEAELEGVEGLRVHRSWWVARAGVTAARREGDRIILTLKSGVEAPVSRANVSAVRAAGWV
jgi:DNA-binding LytR/AlgR family response regulator